MRGGRRFSVPPAEFTVGGDMEASILMLANHFPHMNFLDPALLVRVHAALLRSCAHLVDCRRSEQATDFSEKWGLFAR